MPFRRPQGTRNPPQARAASRPSGGPVNRGGAAVVGLVIIQIIHPTGHVDVAIDPNGIMCSMYVPQEQRTRDTFDESL